MKFECPHCKKEIELWVIINRGKATPSMFYCGEEYEMRKKERCVNCGEMFPIAEYVIQEQLCDNCFHAKLQEMHQIAKEREDQTRMREVDT